MKQTSFIVFCLTYSLCSFIFFGTITRKISFGMGFSGVFYFILSGIFFSILNVQLIFFLVKKKVLKSSDYYTISLLLDFFMLGACIYFITLGRGVEEPLFYK